MGMTTSSSVIEAGSRRVPPLPWTLKWEAADQPVWSDARASQAVISAAIVARTLPACARAAARWRAFYPKQQLGRNAGKLVGRTGVEPVTLRLKVRLD
jgi:hypothetical protein